MEGADEEVSNEVDKRIIEMEFKNAEFEKNAAKTLQTLQELKTKLNDNFSTKGAEKLNEAIQSVNVSPITKGIEAVQFQFSALQIAGKRVIENITDAAMNAVSKITSKLTGVINQIKVGGANRAQNIEQAKFMLSGLGIEWKDIVDDINYGVQDTAYGLDAAAKVASQLVASNVSLGADMQASLRGVSGVAAMTNSTYEEIGHIFTSVAGQGRLMSMQLQQFSLRGLNVAADLAKSMGTTEAAIREMVSKGQIDFMTFAKAMDELYGGHAKEANKTFTGALSNTKAALSRLGADIAAKRFDTLRDILVKLIPKLKELKAALKPIEDSINNAMEAAGKLVEFLIDRIDVKGIIESITPSVQRVINKITEFANTTKDYIQKLDESKPGKFIKNLQETADTVEKIVNFTQAEYDLAKRIWEVGDLGNGEERVRIITEIGQSYERVQAAVDTFINSGHDWNSVVVEGTEATEEAADAVEDLNKAASNSEKPTTIYLIVDALYNLSKIIKNVVYSAVNILSVIKDSFKEVFSPRGAAGELNTFTGLLASISDKLYITKEDVEDFKPLIVFIFNVIKALGKAMSTLAKAALIVANKIASILNTIRNSSFVNKALDIVGKALKVISNNLKIVFNRLKEAGVIEKLVNLLKLVGMWLGEKLVNALVFLANHSGDFFVTIGNGFSTVIGWIETVIEKLSEGNGILGKIKDFFVKGVETGGSWIERIGDKLSSLFGSEGDNDDSIFKKAYDRAAAFGRGIIEGLNSISWDDIKKAGGIVLKIYSALSLLSFLGSLVTMNTSISQFFKGLANLFKSFTSLTYATALRTAASAIESLARSLALIIGAVIALTLVFAYVPDSERIAEKSIKIVYEFTVMVGFFEVLMAMVEKTKLLNKGKKISITLNARKLAMAAIMTSVATMLWTFVQYVKFVADGLGSDDWSKQETFRESLKISLVLIIGIFSMLFLYIAAIMKMADKMKGSIVGPELLRAIAKVVDSFTTSIMKIMAALAILTLVLVKFDPEGKSFGRAIWAFIGITVALLTLVGIVALTSANMTEYKKEDINVMIDFFNTFTYAITTLMLAIAAVTFVFSKVKGTDIALALTTFGLIFAALLGSLYIINKINISNEEQFKTKMNALMKITGILSLLIAAFSALALSMGAMKSMGVDMKEFAGMVALIVGSIAAISLVGGLIGLIPGGAASMTAIGAVMAGFGVALLGVAAAVITLALAFKIIIDVLPRFVSAFETFHKQIENKRDIVIAGIGDFIGVLAAGLLVGIIKALNALIDNMGPILDALVDTIIVICNTLGGVLITRSSEIAQAIGTLFEGITKVVIEAIASALGGIILGIVEAVKDAMDGDLLPDPEGYTEETDWGGYKDSQAQAFAKYLENENLEEDRKKAYKRWLKENGYDEEGNRTETWTTEIVMKYSVAYDLENNQKALSKAQEYEQRYGGAAVSSSAKVAEQAEEVKENTEAAADSFVEANNNAGLMDKLSGAMTEKLSGAQQKISDINIADSIGDMTDMMPQFGEDIAGTEALETFSDNLATEAEETATTTEEYANIVNEKTKILETAVNNMAEAIGNTLKNLGEESKKYGKGVVDGLVEGMTDMSATVTLRKGCLFLADTITDTIKGKDGLDERSPSHVMEKIGIYAIMGLAEGISESASLATNASEEAGKSTILSLRNTIKKLYNESADVLNTSPRITPILDLSNIADGVDSMNSMFDSTHAYRLAMATSAEAQAANASRRAVFYQNGNTYDDTNAIGAINSLNDEVSTLKDAINGMQVVIDGRALVGQIATPMDKALGKKVLAGRRKV